MNDTASYKNAVRLFTIIAIGMTFWLWLSLSLTLTNAFFTPLLWISAVALLGVGGYVAYKQKLCKNISREMITIMVASLVIALLIAFITVPTIFSGRDQGSYSAAAIHLARNHQLAFSTPASDAFFALHGPGKALNFPGFDYTGNGSLTTQFPLGYISWLASCFALFGLFGLSIANALTLAIFLIAFYLLTRIFVSRFYATFGFVIAATSLPVVWFSKMTLSENLALALFTMLTLHLTLALKEKSRLHSALSLAIAGFFVFTRIEGIVFFAITTLLLAGSGQIRSLWKSWPRRYTVVPAALFLILFIRSLFLDFPFYKAIAKAGIGKWHSLFKPCIESDCLSDTSASLWSVLWLYGLIPVFIIGIVSIAVFFKGRHKLALIPFILALPTFFYLFAPSISGDHPWMLRRFVFSIYPAMLFSSIVGIALIQTFLTRKYAGHVLFTKRYYATVLLSLLLLSQLPFALQYAGFAENRGLLEQTSALAAHFSDTDLVLVDRSATGDAWSMLPEALSFFGVTNAVYFFNPEDFATLDTSKFTGVYLITPEENLGRYLEATSSDDRSIAERSVPIATYGFQIQRLVPSTDVAMPHTKQTITKNVILQIK